MKSLLLIVMAIRLNAQETTPPRPEETKKSDAATTAVSPVPAPAEPWFTGTIDLGYRWRSDVDGSFDTYRSIVNLGSGPKLLGTEFTIADPNHRWFDRINIHAYNWGDDPNASFHLRATKSRLYEFNADYRDIAYFNFLPSFADPLLARGITLNQQSFDTRRRLGRFELEWWPGKWLIPYVAYERDSGSGSGVATFVTGGNQFPVPNTLYDLTNLYRGGVRIELRRLHATLEQGGTTFKDDQSLFQNGGLNFGDVNTPVLGQTLILNNLLAAYGIRGSSIYSKVLLSANALSWLDLYGQFLYSQPETDTSYQQAAAGTLFQQNPLLFYTSQQFILSAGAKMPHTTGSASAEIRPLRNVRILQSWLTDRLHNTASASSLDRLFGTGVAQVTAALLDAGLITNYNQLETDLIWDASLRLTLRGGYRRVWGDASQAILPPEGLVSADNVELRRNVILGGFTFRPWQKLSVTGEVEGATDSRPYFRTGLRDYEKARAQVRYQAATGLSFSADFNLLNNQNPAPDIRNDYLARQASVSLLWSPANAKRFDFQGSYTRSTLRSNILFLTPQNLLPQESIYRENAHIVTALWNVKLPHAGPLAPKITGGGSFFISSGSRPTSYSQPLLKLWVPAGKRLNWFAEWRYYGFGEPFYPYEDFHAHTITAGVRIAP